jgi:hypothetical protein
MNIDPPVKIAAPLPIVIPVNFRRVISPRFFIVEKLVHDYCRATERTRGRKKTKKRKTNE